MSLPYLKDVLVSLHNDVVVSMKDMSSSLITRMLKDAFDTTSSRSPCTCRSPAEHGCSSLRPPHGEHRPLAPPRQGGVRLLIVPRHGGQDGGPP
jgi:hypothetical protein